MNRETSYRISYIILRKAGLTHEAALAMQGNWAKESLHDAFRKQGDLSEAAIPSHNYVAAVTSGAISREQFARDQIGFGLAQWTYYNFDTGKGRKLNLYDFWKRSGQDLDDPGMQTDFAVWELQHEFAGVYAELKKSTNLYYCTDLICKRYEQPSFNNVDDRYKAALEIKAIIEAEPEDEPEPEPPKEDTPDTVFWPPRVLCRGMMGTDVRLLQSLLACHGYPCGHDGVADIWVSNMICAFQSENGLVADAIAGPKTFQALGLAKY